MAALQRSPLAVAIQTACAASFALGCSGSATPSYEVLYNFAGRPGDGSDPQANLIDVNGVLYGTTRLGGANNVGTVFELSPTGNERMLYSFKGGPDGALPCAGLVDVNGTLYGTTALGGSSGSGTVFEVSTSGRERVLHSFADDDADGAYPQAGLTALNGVLYGTTIGGGPKSYGTVFEMSTAGAEHVLHKFGSVPNGQDGVEPVGGLVAANGVFYGTTDGGGASGTGTVFAVSASGAERVIYSFGTIASGEQPDASLTYLGGTLYGTTSSGGASGFGTIFAVSTLGKERTLHSFTTQTDGGSPRAGLVDVNGTLYGTAYQGGNGGCNGFGCGSVFAVNTSGAFRVLHIFHPGTDGAQPVASLIDVNGKLYGTTLAGGKHGTSDGGFGTVFAITH